jgi:protein gp37
MGNTKIEWAEKTWNPITGCTKISEGCRNCYAERMSKRLAGRYGYPADDPFKVTFRPERLGEPLKWKKPSRIFVCSMGDLFHEDVPDEFIDQVFGVILACRVLNNIPNHTFLILTKRPERMVRYLTEREPVELLKAWANIAPVRTDNEDITFDELVYSECCHDWDKNGRNSKGSEYKPWGYVQKLWPLPNVWLGVTAENQEQADKRIPILLQIQAAVRFVSVEPMLGPISLGAWLLSPGWIPTYYDPDNCNGYPSAEPTNENIQWVICGGESGPGARPIHPEWARNLRDQCVAAGVPFFLKQMDVAGKLVKMPELDGQRWAQWPEATS